MPIRPIQMERIILKYGWKYLRNDGRHRIYVHENYPGIVTIPFHSGELSKIIEKKIYKQARIDRRPTK